MNKEKQIEEMAETYEEARLKANETLGSMNEGADRWYANAFYNAGYRKASEVAEEIFAEIYELLGMLMTDYHNESRFSDADVIRYATDYLVSELKKKYAEKKHRCYDCKHCANTNWLACEPCIDASYWESEDTE